MGALDNESFYSDDKENQSYGLQRSFTQKSQKSQSKSKIATGAYTSKNNRDHLYAQPILECFEIELENATTA